MDIQRIPIETIVVKDKIQQRADLNDEYVEDLVVEIANGVKLPPLIVFKHGDELLLTDGFHRFNAFLLAEIDTVEVEIYEGTEREATLHAVGANADHGLRRTNADKRFAVTTLLNDKEWGNWSDGEIARRCRVSQPFVSKVRNELTQNGFESNPMRKGSDGRILNTSNIGVRPQAEESEDPQTSEESVSPQSEEETTTTEEEYQTETPEEDNAGIEAGSDSDEGVGVTASINNDETGADDESSDQSEEDNIGPDGNDVDGTDESTSTDNNEDEPVPDSSPEEQATQEEDEEPEPGSNDPSSEEATEDTGDDNSSSESEVDESQRSSVDLPHTDEVQTLKANIDVLENTIAEKDQRIEELEAENAKLQGWIQELEEQLIASDDYVEPAEELSSSPVY
jgi:hypothetical protein